MNEVPPLGTCADPLRKAKGSFFNYVDQILPTYLPIPCSHWGGNYFSVIWENLHIVDISGIIYLPRLVNVVKERPLGRIRNK